MGKGWRGGGNLSQLSSCYKMEQKSAMNLNWLTETFSVLKQNEIYPRRTFFGIFGDKIPCFLVFVWGRKLWKLRLWMMHSKCSLESSGWTVLLSLLIARATLWDHIRVISVGLGTRSKWWLLFHRRESFASHGQKQGMEVCFAGGSRG